MAHKNANKRNKTRVEHDRREIARRYMKGETQAAIAEVLGLSQQQISYDLKAIKAQWLESSLVDFNTIRARELARIDVLEREYWQAWQASCADRTIKSKDEKRLGTGEASTAIETKLHQRIEQRDGNPQFLAGIQWCIEQRCKVFGLYDISISLDWRREATEAGLDAGALYEQLVQQYASALSAG